MEGRYKGKEFKVSLFNIETSMGYMKSYEKDEVKSNNKLHGKKGSILESIKETWWNLEKVAFFGPDKD